MLKDKILKLRNLNLTYKQIANKLKCSKGTISYHLNPLAKDGLRARQRKRRLKNHPYQAKIERFITCKAGAKLNKAISTLEQLLNWKVKKFHMKSDKKWNYDKRSFTVKDVIDKIGENPKCYLTGESIDITNTRSYAFDHIIPRSRGGENSLDNLNICTSQVNKSKSDMTPEEFIELCKTVLINDGYKISK